ncbi:MAG: OadG family protein [Treponema sp.]|nr:OadG family protein [Treponema sp.]
MTIIDMLKQSGLLTLLGMGVVFSFIIIMILSMHALHAVLHALKLDVEEKKSAAASAAVQPSAPARDDAAIAAIAAALHK